MAIYHLQSKIIKRSDHRSAVAAAAYRSGEELYDVRKDETHKYGRSERVASSEIIAPDYAQPWAADRNNLWNSLEAVEKRKDAQLAKEVEVALPHELTLQQQKELLAGWIDEHFTQKGFVADVNIHHSPIGKTKNDHAHVMSPFRAIDPDTGEWRKTKDRPDSKTAFKDGQSADTEALRASWASHVNAALLKAGHEDHQVDHRSNKARGIQTIPTIHEGYAAHGIEARGERSWRIKHNQEIRKTNRQILEQIKASATKARAELIKYRDHLAKTLSERIGNQLAGLNLRPTVAPTVTPKAAPTVVTPTIAPAVTPLATDKTRRLAEHLARGPVALEPLRPKPDSAQTKGLADRLARGPVDLEPPAPAPARMKPDKLAKGPADTAPKSAPAPAPKPLWQPPPMRPDKLPASPGPVDVVPPVRTPAPAPKKQEPAPAPIAAKQQPTRLPEMPPLAVPDAEAEKRKKAAHLAAMRHHGGGGIGG
jgi:hypothetical protein